MSEVLGISPEVARFARWVRDAGFTVCMPNLFGQPGQKNTAIYVAATVARACIAREFMAFASNKSGPATAWLRALAADAFRTCGGKGVGAVGMCFTGNFALSMMLERAVIAPVLSQPSLPLNNPSGLHIAPEELEEIKKRLDEEDLVVRAYRFEGDRLCRSERFAAYREALGERFEGRVLPDAAANPAPRLKMPHAVLTAHLIDEAGQPTRQAVEDVIAYFRERL
jgi:dienelactone hydrolase